jgi:uncharacterized membrane protein
VQRLVPAGGENQFAAVPTAAHGAVLLAAAAACYGLQTVIIRDQGKGSLVAAAVGADRKGKVSMLLVLTGIGLSFVDPWPAIAACVVVTRIWLVPDRRLERTIAARLAGQRRRFDG